MIEVARQPISPANSRRKRSRSRGQSMVEFAMVLPLMLGFLVIAADFGRAYTAYLTISSAAREGATYASRSEANADDETEIIARTRAEVGSGGQIWGEPITVDPDDCPSGFDPGYRCIEVTVDYTFEPLFSIWPMPPDVDMQRTVRMRVLGN